VCGEHSGKVCHELFVVEVRLGGSSMALAPGNRRRNDGLAEVAAGYICLAGESPAAVRGSWLAAKL